MREELRVKGARFEGTFGFVLRADRIDLSWVRGTQKNFARGIARDTRDLRGPGLREMGENAVSINGQESAIVTCPCQQAAIGSEPERVNDIFARSPNLFRRAFVADAVDAGGHDRRKWNEGLLGLGLPGIHDGASGERCGALRRGNRSEEHTSELQSHSDLVCRLLLEKKNNIT